MPYGKIVEQYMNKKTLLACCCSLLMLGSQAFADTPSQIDPAPIVKQSITQLMQKDQIPGVAVVIYENGQPYSYYFGYRNIAHKRLVNDKTLFEIGSVTKLFTCLLLAIEVNQNTLQLNNTLAQFLPSLHQTKAPAASINLEELATHTSGLPLNSPLALNATFNINTIDTLHQYLLTWQPASPVGSQWQYSNFGMGLLGISIEDKIGWPYNKLVAAYIFKPLKMKDSGLNIANWNLNYADAYSNGKVVPHFKMLMFPAAGGIEASPRDMQHFLSAALGLPGTPPAIEAAMKMTQTPYAQTSTMQQGLGWEIYPFNPQDPQFIHQPAAKNLGPMPATQLSASQSVYNGNALLQKTGATNGFRTYIGLVPNTQTGIVILANSYFSEGDLVNTGRTILTQLINNKQE
ncbi:MAG: ampC 2 [Gammaproteobacteria bacterium]|jgi:beta-lactamase class C|nr:ampC 2 [Gammaproteobacteria bacterium]